MPRNPFKDRTMRSMYDAMVRVYHTKHPDLIRADGSRSYGNGFASYFWRGYDNVNPNMWDRPSRQIIGYACYRAGRDIAKEETGRSGDIGG